MHCVTGEMNCGPCIFQHTFDTAKHHLFVNCIRLEQLAPFISESKTNTLLVEFQIHDM